MSGITGAGHLAFYDSISPIVDAESIDMKRVYFAARWDKGTADYINCPMDRAEYDRFLDALLAAEAAEAKGVGEARLFRGLPAHRSAGAARARHAALWAHEAGGAARSAHRQDALGRGAIAQGESARGQLQPGGFSESFEIWRAGAGAAADSGAGERALPALRADSSQHLHSGAAAAG